MKRTNDADRPRSSRRVWLAAAWMLLLVAACKPAAEHPDGPVAARVNGEVITQSQLAKSVETWRKGIPAEGASAQQLALDALVDERLLVQKALESRLDEDPATARAIEQSRRRVLAQAVVTSAIGPIDVDRREARAFFSANPHLFERRKIYAFSCFVLAAGKLDAPLKARLDTAKSAADVRRVLAAAKQPFHFRTEVRGAEALPAEALAQAVRMNPGDILAFAEDGKTVLLQLRTAIDAPMSFSQAQPTIEAYLSRLMKEQAAAKLLRNLRRDARIEYLKQAAGPDLPATRTAGNPAFSEPGTKKHLQSQQVTLIR